MSYLGRIMVKEMRKIGTNAKVIQGNVMGNITPNIEWSKWLSYEPTFEKKRLKYLNSKKISELTLKEIEEINKYKKNKLFAKLFKIYGTNKCSLEDTIKVYEYMHQESIEKLMLSKLTSKELEYADKEITRLSHIPKNELAIKIKNEKQKEVYLKLSMVDAYILHFISNICYDRSLSDLNKEIMAQRDTNDLRRQKSLYYTK